MTYRSASLRNQLLVIYGFSLAIGVQIGLIRILFSGRLAPLFTSLAASAVLGTVGAALVRHKTKSPYIHLATGSALFMLASAIPWLGGFVTFAVVVVGMGAVVATRAGGLLAGRARSDSGPYRTAAT